MENVEIFQVGDTVTYYLKNRKRTGKILRADHDIHIYLVEFMPSTSVWLSYVQLTKIK